MNAKEAREILKRLKPELVHKFIDSPSHEIGFMRGYLEALEGPEVKALVEALEYYEKTYPHGFEFDGVRKKALAQYREAIKK